MNPPLGNCTDGFEYGTHKDPQLYTDLVCLFHCPAPSCHFVNHDRFLVGQNEFDNSTNTKRRGPTVMPLYLLIPSSFMQVPLPPSFRYTPTLSGSTRRSIELGTISRRTAHSDTRTLFCLGESSLITQWQNNHHSSHLGRCCVSLSIIQKVAYSNCIYVLVHIVHISLVHGLEYCSRTTKYILVQVIRSSTSNSFRTAISTNLVYLNQLEYSPEEGHRRGWLKWLAMKCCPVCPLTLDRLTSILVYALALIKQH